jgi:hypothetical protein
VLGTADYPAAVMSGQVTSYPVQLQERAVLEHPDQRTPWVILLAANLQSPVGDLVRNLEQLARAAPITAARLAGDRWVVGPVADVLTSEGDPIDDERLAKRFDLEREPPVRVVVDPTGTRLALAGHHAALDGLGMAGVLGALVGGPAAVATASPSASPTGGSSPDPGKRGLRRADRVAASADRPGRESLVSRPIEIVGPWPTARLAAACVAAAGAHNARVGARWKRVGLSLGIGGQPGVGNTASYRRVDAAPGADIESAVRAAVATPSPPVKDLIPSYLARALAPVVHWFSDSILVSNLGRLTLPGVEAVEFYPVARGRSAVSFGAAGVQGGTSVLTVRARDLNRQDAAALAEDAVRRFEDYGSD